MTIVAPEASVSRDPRVLNVRGKSWSICAVFQCKRPTASGVPEKDVTRRYCGVHMPSTREAFRRNLEKNTTLSCVRNSERTRCVTIELSLPRSFSFANTHCLILSEPQRCIDPDNPYRVSRRRCSKGFKPPHHERVERTLWLVVGENQWGERIYLAHVPMVKDRSKPFSEWSLTRDQALRFETKFKADAHLERALRFLKVWDERLFKKFRVVRYYPARATRNKERGKSKEIFSHEFASLRSRTKQSDPLRRRIFRILVEKGPMRKEELDRLYGEDSSRIMPTLVDRGKARKREDGRWEVVRSKDGEEFEL